jgi:hypothetical protein
VSLVAVAEPQTAEELYALYKRVLARRYNPPVRRKKVILALVPPAPPTLVHRTRWYEYEESWARTKAAIHALRNIGGRSHAELIVTLVARETGIPEHLILASDRMVGTRSPKVVKARTEAITRLYTATRWSTPKIGRFFGGRDPTTILHALYKTGVKQHAGKIMTSDSLDVTSFDRSFPIDAPVKEANVKLTRHSPSSLNLFCAAPALWVLERVLDKRQPVGVSAHRGTAVEAGVAFGLLNPKAATNDAVEVARKRYRELTALSGDPRREKYGADIEVMVLRALDELRPYGVPSAVQKYVEWRPDGLRRPIIGYIDFEWAEHGVLVDLKTTEKLPSKIKIAHARQVALYCSSDNLDGRVSYITPIKSATYAVENIGEHRNALHQIALCAERFLDLFPDDPEKLAGIVCPDLESFYWAPDEARQAAFEQWKI